MKKKNPLSTLFLRCGQIEWCKDQYYKDRRGLEEEEEMEVLLFEWTPWEYSQHYSSADYVKPLAERRVNAY